MTKRIKILALPSWYPTDSNPGFGIFVHRHLVEISRYCDVQVLYFDYSKKNSTRGGRCSTKEVDGIQVHEVCVGSSFGRIFSLFLTWFWYVRLVLFGSLGNHDIKHVHVPFHIGVFLSPFILLSRKPFVITEHWSGYFKEDGRFDKLFLIYRKTLKVLMSRAGEVTAVSDPLSLSIRASLNFHKKIQIIPNVVDLNIKVRKPDAIKPDNFLMIANFNNTEKNLTGVIDAFAKFRSGHPHSILTVIGKGPDLKLIQSYVSEKCLGEAVRLPGYINSQKLSSYFAEATCYILNSNFETFSISTLEALLHGVPVISTKCKGPESFINSRNGLLVDVGANDQLLVAMERMSATYLDYDPQNIRNSIPQSLISNTGELFYSIYKNLIPANKYYAES